MRWKGQNFQLRGCVEKGEISYKEVEWTCARLSGYKPKQCICRTDLTYVNVNTSAQRCRHYTHHKKPQNSFKEYKCVTWLKAIGRGTPKPTTNDTILTQEIKY